MGSLAGIAPARTVRETAGLLLSNRDKDGQVTGLGGAFSSTNCFASGSVPALLLVVLRREQWARNELWPVALSRQPAASLSGSPQRRYLRPVIVTVTNYLSARVKRERKRTEGPVGIEPTSRCLTDSRTNHCATDPNTGALLHRQRSQGPRLHIKRRSDLQITTRERSRR